MPMRVLSAIDRALEKSISVFTGITMIALLVLVNAQVIARYVFKFSLGGFSSAPPYIMIYAIWMAAILSARNDDHLKIEILELIVKSVRAQKTIKLVLDAITAAALLYFTVYAALYVISAKQYGDMETGMLIPMWTLYIVMPIGSGFMGIYYIVHVIKGFGEVFLCCR